MYADSEDVVRIIVCVCVWMCKCVCVRVMCVHQMSYTEYVVLRTLEYRLATYAYYKRLITTY